jgi:hypothetical protein
LPPASAISPTTRFFDTRPQKLGKLEERPESQQAARTTQDFRLSLDDGHPLRLIAAGLLVSFASAGRATVQCRGKTDSLRGIVDSEADPGY